MQNSSIIILLIMFWLSADSQNDKLPSNEQPFIISLFEKMKTSDKVAFESTIRSLVNSGVKPEKFEELLGPAVINDDKFYLNLLLATGCDIRATNTHGENIAVYVVEKSKDKNLEKNIKILITLGIDLNLKDKYGYCVLHKIAMNNRVNALLILKKVQGININTLTKDGQTPLILAARYGSVDILEILISLGADLNVRDATGKTALNWAEKSIDQSDFNETNILKESRAKAAAILRKNDATSGDSGSHGGIISR
jgi:ankyrin repeat protein